MFILIGNQDEETNENDHITTFIFHPSLPLIMTKQLRSEVRGEVVNLLSSCFFCWLEESIRQT